MNEEQAVPGSYMINDQSQKVEVIFKEESPEVPKLDSDNVFHGSYNEWKEARKAGKIK